MFSGLLSNENATDPFGLRKSSLASLTNGFLRADRYCVHLLSGVNTTLITVIIATVEVAVFVDVPAVAVAMTLYLDSPSTRDVGVYVALVAPEIEFHVDPPFVLRCH